jgi:hypothetical protein
MVGRVLMQRTTESYRPSKEQKAFKENEAAPVMLQGHLSSKNQKMITALKFVLENSQLKLI